METQHVEYPVSPSLLKITPEEIAALDHEATGGEGWEYYCGGYITQAIVFLNKISGRVREYFGDYVAEVQVNGKELVTSCSCSSRNGMICKHVIALLYSWVNDGEGFIDLGKSIEVLRGMDKENLIEIIGRILMNDPSNWNFVYEENASEENYDIGGLFN